MEGTTSAQIADYTTGELGTPTDTVTYAYGDDSWGDLLTAYDGAAITYDGIGNPNAIGGWIFTWEHGRQLVAMSNGMATWTNTYNADGLRIRRTNGSKTYSYIYSGSTLTQMTVGADTLYFTYDASGVPLTVTHNGTTYYYATNLQWDITAILDANGTTVVAYTYDAWGNPLSTTGTMAATLGAVNPLRYRGYVYDAETELYYLQSRYYNPEIGRFINADGYTSTGDGLSGNNMFAYCGNNPVNRIDPSGQSWLDPIIEMLDALRPLLGLPKKDLVEAPDLDVNTANPENYHCYGNAINKKIYTDPTGFVHYSSVEDVYSCVVFDLGYRNVRRLNSIDDPIGEDEYMVALRCGEMDYHFIRLDDSGWYNKSGPLAGIYIDRSDVLQKTWYPITIKNGKKKVRDTGFGLSYYEGATIYFAVKKGWDAR